MNFLIYRNVYITLPSPAIELHKFILSIYYTANTLISFLQQIPEIPSLQVYFDLY